MIIGISGKIGSGKDTVGNIIQYLTSVYLKGFYEGERRYSLEQYNKQNTPTNISPFKIKKFADALKDIVCILIGCTREQLEDREFKEKELGEEWWYHKDFSRLIPYNKDLVRKWGKESIVKLTPRLLLQLLGTECGRNIIHPNVWVNSLMSKYKPNVYWMCDNCMNDNIHQLIQIPNRFKDQGYTEDEYVCPTCKGKESEGDITMVLPDNYDNWIITDVRFPNEFEAVKKRGGIMIRVHRDLPCTLCGLTQAERRGDSCKEIACPNGRPKHESETALDNTNFDYIINNNGSIEDLINKVREILIKEKII